MPPHPLLSQPVALAGLAARPELNGQRGTVVFFTPSSGRLTVLLDAQGGAAPTLLQVKPCNLEAHALPPPAAAAPPLRPCAACGAPATVACGRCNSQNFCSAPCQREDWHAGGHKAACAAAIALAQARLHPSAHAGDAPGVLAALAAGAAVNALAPPALFGARGYSALHLAAAGGRAGAVGALAAHGARLDMPTLANASGTGGSTALMLAVSAGGAGGAAAVALLLAAGASVHCANDSGWGALHFAAMGGELAMVAALVGAGALANAVNHGGDSPCALHALRVGMAPGADDVGVAAALKRAGGVALTAGALANLPRFKTAGVLSHPGFAAMGHMVARLSAQSGDGGMGGPGGSWGLGVPLDMFAGVPEPVGPGNLEFVVRSGGEGSGKEPEEGRVQCRTA